MCVCEKRNKTNEEDRWLAERRDICECDVCGVWWGNKRLVGHVWLLKNLTPFFLIKKKKKLG